MTVITPDPLAEIFDFEEDQAVSPEREEYLRQLRGLVESAGRPYIKISFEPLEDDADSGQAHFDVVGIAPAAVPQVLRELADLLDAQ